MTAAAEDRAQPGELEGVGGTRLRTLLWTPERAEPTGRVVIVHGLGEHAGRYADFARFLTSRGLAVLAYDQRGHGRSGGRPGVGSRFEALLDDLDRVLGAARADLPGPGEPILLGHSMGGLVVLRHLQTRGPSLTGAVLSAPWLRTAARIPLWKRAARVVLGRVAPDLTLGAGVDATVLTRDPERQRAFLEDPLVHDRVSAGLFDAMVAAQEEAGADPLPADLPVLVLVPTDDRLADPGATRRWAEAAGPTVTVELLGGYRHEPLNDLGRGSVWQGVSDWMERRLRREPESDASVRE